MQKVQGIVLTEDSGSDSFAVVSGVLKKIFHFIDPSCRTHTLNLHPTENSVQEIVHANIWKSDAKEHRDKIGELHRYLARQVAMGNVIFFHFDGDVAWARRLESENVIKFSKRIRAEVLKLLSANPKTRDNAKECIDRLVEMTPFYSIESWLFQNIDRAKMICLHNKYDKDINEFYYFEKNRHDVDEVLEIKNKMSFTSKHNFELVNGFPVDIVYSLNKSFCSFVCKCAFSDKILELIEDTYK